MGISHVSASSPSFSQVTARRTGTPPCWYVFRHQAGPSGPDQDGGVLSSIWKGRSSPTFSDTGPTRLPFLGAPSTPGVNRSGPQRCSFASSAVTSLTVIGVWSIASFRTATVTLSSLSRSSGSSRRIHTRNVLGPTVLIVAQITGVNSRWRRARSILATSCAVLFAAIAARHAAIAAAAEIDATTIPIQVEAGPMT